LNESNYRSWSQQIKWILDERDLLEIVEGTEPSPAPPTPAEDGNVDEAAQSVHREDLAAWQKKAKKARSIIGSSISASVMTYLEGINNPSDMWTTLEEKYSPKTVTTLLQVVRELMTVKMDDGVDTMEQHLQKLQRLKRRVEEHGETISDTIFNGILLNSITDTYNVVVSILESQDKLTPTVIVNRLLEEYRKGGMAEKTKMALLTKQKDKAEKGGKFKDKAGSKGKRCDTCGKTSHDKASCWVEHPELRPKEKGKGE